MRIVLQRVSRAAVRIDGQVIAAIERGVVLLIGISNQDHADDFPRVASKIGGLRIFEDDQGKRNRSVHEIGGEILAIPQFTLYGDTRKGRRPSFAHAAPPEKASPLFDAFIETLRAEELSIQTGRFGAKMAVELVNDGPVTFVIDLAQSRAGG